MSSDHDHAVRDANSPRYTHRMADSIKTLLTSKRVMVAVAAILADVLVLSFDVGGESAHKIAMLVTTIAGILIGGISVSDHGKAMGQPAGVDHKGRGVTVKPLEIVTDLRDGDPDAIAKAFTDALNEIDARRASDDGTPEPEDEPAE